MIFENIKTSAKGNLFGRYHEKDNYWYIRHTIDRWKNVTYDNILKLWVRFINMFFSKKWFMSENSQDFVKKKLKVQLLIECGF